MNLPVRPLRVLGFWIAMFIPLYAMSFLLYAFWVASKGSPVATAALQALTPIGFFVASYLYYRKDGASGWIPRLLIIPVWILLSIAASAVLVQPIYGYSWQSILNAQVFQNQGPTIAMLLLANFLVSRKKTPSQPPLSLKEEEAPFTSDVDSLEGPKFE